MSDVTAEPEGAAPRSFIEAEPARPVGKSDEPSRADRARGRGYRSRFGIIYAALAVIVGVAVAALAILVTRPESAPAPRWSVWQPTGSDSAKAKQIADHVSTTYRQANGQQMTTALVGPPTVSAASTAGGDIPVRAIAVRPDTSTGKKEENDIAIINAENSLMFLLCGLGESCSIIGGSPSVARHALLRREALELALYTFKYVPGIDSISVFLPPAKGAVAKPTSVFVRKADLEEELSKPLTRTVAPKTPTVGRMTKLELARVNRITSPRLYSYEYQQAQDGSAVLVYDPVIGA
ncbi:MAG: hypothetical protein ABIO99_11380 [Candidatus Limnocylindria bacterium]